MRTLSAPLARRAGALLLALSAVVLGSSGCSLGSGHRAVPAGPFLARIRHLTTRTSVLAGGPGSVAAKAAHDLFVSAPVVVIANPDSPAAMAAAVADAMRVHAPVLLASRHSAAKAGPSALVLGKFVRAEIKALRPRALLDVGLALGTAQLLGIPVVTALAKLPRTRTPVPLTGVVVLMHRGDSGPAESAVTATAKVAGARLLVLRGYDPRADRATITALSTLKPVHLLALGSRFGPARRLAARVAAAATGVQLPGGGQVLFPDHRLVALYGSPDSTALGALGEQDLTASIARVKHLAALYRPLSKVPVVPTFEIIASVAQGADEPEGGTYSYLTPVAQLRPWVRAATAAGLYVVLDLQPGRASLLAQAKWYRQLLTLPDVGLAIDPEWKLLPSQLPLHQIGSASATEINSVITWLAGLTARHHLPQKLLVLHQFRLSMLGDEPAIDTGHDDLAIVIHMDGQGTPSEKQETWNAVLGAAPHGVYFGWKNFFVKDHPMLTPSQTMARAPQPVMISYQ